MINKIGFLIVLLIINVLAATGTLGTNEILSWVLGPLLGGLVVYFFSTRNLEANVKRVSQKEVDTQITIHKQIYHQDSPWDVVNKHRSDCGDKLDKKIDQMVDCIHRLDVMQERTSDAMRGIGLTLAAIAKKLDIIPIHIPQVHKTGEDE